MEPSQSSVASRQSSSSQSLANHVRQPSFLLVPSPHVASLSFLSSCPLHNNDMQPYASSSTYPQRPIISILTQRNRPDVPSSVRGLLLSTKSLQELLKQWSTGQATETQVSDVFVEVGTNFNNTVRAFAFYQIDLRCAYIPSSLDVVFQTGFDIVIYIRFRKSCGKCWSSVWGRNRRQGCWRVICRT